MVKTPKNQEVEQLMQDFRDEINAWKKERGITDPRFFTILAISEAAILARVDKQVVRSAIKRGQLAASQPGGKYGNYQITLRNLCKWIVNSEKGLRHALERREEAKRKYWEVNGNE